MIAWLACVALSFGMDMTEFGWSEPRWAISGEIGPGWFDHKIVDLDLAVRLEEDGWFVRGHFMDGTDVSPDPEGQLRATSRWTSLGVGKELHLVGPLVASLGVAYYTARLQWITDEIQSARVLEDGPSRAAKIHWMQKHGESGSGPAFLAQTGWLWTFGGIGGGCEVGLLWTCSAGIRLRIPFGDGGD